MSFSKDQILIAGYYGHRNAGDESILQGMLATLREKCVGASFVVVSADPNQTSHDHNVRSIDWSDIEELMDEVERSALVIVGGGGLFHDYWGFDETSFLSSRQGGISEFGSPLVWAHLLGVHCMLYGVGVGPLRGEASRKAVRELFDMADAIVVRDAYSKRTLEDIGFNVEQVQVAADPAFSAPRIPIEDIMPAILDVPRPLLGVSVRPWAFSGSQERWESEIAKGLRLYLDSHAGTVLFVPMQDGEMEIENDVLVCERIRDLIAKPERVLPIDRSIEPLHRVSLFESCDLVLGMRLHSLIGAIRGGVPCVGLSYDPKVTSLMESARISNYCHSLKNITLGEISDSLETALINRSKLNDLLIQKLAEFSENLDLLAEECINLFHSSTREKESRKYLLSSIFQDRMKRLARTELEKKKIENEILTSRRTIEQLESELNTETVRRDQIHLELQSEKERNKQISLELSRLQNSVGIARNDLRLTEKRLNEAKIEVSKTREQLRISNLKVNELRMEIGNIEKMKLELKEQKAQVVFERDSVRTTLSKLQNTTGVRLLGFYWSSMRKLMPVGSRRRLWYFRIRKFVGSVVKRIGRIKQALFSKKPAVDFNPLGEDSEISLEAVKYHDDLQDFVSNAVNTDVNKIFTIFSPVAFSEDEGQRVTNLALEMLKLNYVVTFVYWRWNTNETCQQNPEYQNLFQIPIDIFIKDPDLLFRRMPSSIQRILLIEFPYPGFFEAIAVADASGWVTIYDVIDDWEDFARVGQAEWFDPEFEKHLVATTDAVAAVNQNLVDKFSSMRASGIKIIPNGSSSGIASNQEKQELERGEITLGYFGYLTDSWFDWDLVKNVAERNREWKIYIVGYGDVPPSDDLPNNVILLGKKPRRILSAYAANWDVGIVPFKPGGVARSADPIKIYEYIAMNLPVVGTGIQPPMGGERFVRIANGSSDFVEQVIKTTRESQVFHSERLSFIQKCTWDKRLKIFFDLIDRGEQQIARKQALFMGNNQI